MIKNKQKISFILAIVMIFELIFSIGLNSEIVHAAQIGDRLRIYCGWASASGCSWHTVNKFNTDPDANTWNGTISAMCLESEKNSPEKTMNAIILNIDTPCNIYGWNSLARWQKKLIVGYMLYGFRYIDTNSYSDMQDIVGAQQKMTWAIIDGVSNDNLVSYVGRRYCQEIHDLVVANPEGYDYEKTWVVVAEGGSSDQDISMIYMPVYLPDIKEVKRTSNWEYSNSLAINIKKNNLKNEPVQGVEFEIKEDNKVIATVTTDESGTASYSVPHTDKGSVSSSAKYITNYDLIDPSNKPKYENYFKTAEAAGDAAQLEANKLAEQAKAQAKEKSHKYTITEKSVPNGYILNSEYQEQMGTEGDNSSLNFLFVNYQTPVVKEITAEGEYTNNVHVDAKILKTDKETQEPLEGFEFALYEDGVEVGTLLTGADGSVTKGFDYPVRKTAKNTQKYIENYDYLNANDKSKYSTYFKSKEEAYAKALEIANADAEKAAANDLVQKHTYKIIEKNVNGNYILDPTPIENTSSGSSTVILTKENVPARGIISIYKEGPGLSSVSEGEGNTYKKFNYESFKYQGAIFELYADEDIHKTPKSIIYKKDTLIGTYSTDKSGKVEIPNLYIGKYRIVEIKAPANLIIDMDEKLPNRTHYVELKYQDQNTPVVTNQTTYNNERAPINVTINKNDANDDSVLANAEFTLYAAEDIYNFNGVKIMDAGTAIEKIITDNEGKAKFTVMLPFNSKFLLKETKAPEGYSIFQEPIEFTTTYKDDITKEYNYHFDVKDLPQVARISIKKTGDTYSNAIPTNDPYNHFDIKFKKVNLKAAKFNIYAEEDIYSSSKTLKYKKGELVQTLSTTNNEVYSKFLPLGKYKIIETKAPEFYVLNEDETTRTWFVNLEYKGQEIPLYTNKLTVDNELAQVKAVAYKKSAKDNTPIKGAEFTLYAGEQINNTINNHSLFNENDAIQTVISDENGVAEFTINIPFGHKYYIKETKAPENYVISDEIYNFTPTYKDDSIPFYKYSHEFKNEEAKGSLLIEKYDFDKFTSEGSKNPSGNATLINAEYSLYARENIIDPNNSEKIIYNKNQLIAKSNINSDGYTSFNNLYIGKYYVKETAPAEGYLIDETIYNVDVIYDNNKVKIEVNSPRGQGSKIMSLEKVKKQPFDFTKVSYEEGYENEKIPVAAAEFTVKLKSDVNTQGWEKAKIITKIKTDKDGYGKSIPLPYGVYIVKETKTPTNLLPINDFEVHIQENSNTPLHMGEYNDMPFKAYIKLVKKDSTSQETILLKNTSFKIYDETRKEFVSYESNNKKITEFKTNNEGIAYTPISIKHGKYSVVEVKAPNGYILNNKKIEFYVNENNAIKEGDNRYVEVNIFNAPVFGNIYIYKQGEVFTKYDNQFVYENKKLANAEFEIYAKENIMSPDNQNNIIYNKDQKIQTVKTGPDGIAISQKLPLGKYYIKETKAPEGYLLDSSIKDVTLYYKDQNSPVVKSEITVNNQRQKIGINIVKIGKAKETDPDSLSMPLSGGEFSLYAAEDIKNNRNIVQIKKDQLIEKQISQEDGLLTFNSDLPYGKYYVVETKAPDGFVTNKNKINIDFKPQGTAPIILKYYKVVNTTTMVIPNKVDKFTEKNLDGAILEIHPSDEEGNYVENIIIDRWTSKKDSPHIVEKLTYGKKYFIKEVQAPNGYIKGEIIPFIPKNIKGEQVWEIVNEQAKGHAKIIKKGERLVSVENNNGKIDFIYENLPLPNVKFKLYADQQIIIPESDTIYNKDDFIEEIISNEQGIAISSNLPLGKYYFKEVSTIDGYVVSTQKIPVVIQYENQDTPITETNLDILNQKTDIKLALTKTDVETGNPVPETKFSLYNKKDILNYEGKVILKANSLISTAYSDKEGKVDFKVNLPAGKYIIEEIAPAPGYSSNGKVENVVEFEAKPSNQKDEVLEIPIKFSNQKVKHIFSKVDVLTNERLDNASLSVLHIEKDENGNLKKDKNGEYVTSLVETWTSDKMEKTVINGETYYGHLIEGKLIVGETYIYKEVLAPMGYILNEVSSNSTKEANKTESIFTVEDNKSVKVHTLKNELAKGEIVIHKTGEILVDYKEPNIFKKAISAINRAFEYVTGSIKDVEFKIYANENIKHPDGVSPDFYKKGDLVATVKTNYLGVAKAENLPLGKYIVKESDPGNGFIQNNKIEEVNLEYLNQNTPVVKFSTDYLNERQKVEINISKKSTKQAESKYVNSDDEMINEDKPLAGAVYGLFTAEDIYAYSINKDGSVVKTDSKLIEKDQLIESQTTDDNGKAKFISDIPLGKYYIKEIKAPEGYHLSDEIFNINADYSKTKEKIVIAHEFTDIPVVIKITKKSSENNEPLQGATLGIFDSNGTLIESWVTTNSPHYVKGLNIDEEYSLQELMAPLGYTVLDPIYFNVKNINEKGEILELQEINDVIDDVLDVELYKQDIESADIVPGAHLQLIDMDNNIVDDWISTDSPHKLNNIRPGKYIYKEISAPTENGYTKADEITIVIQNTSENQDFILNEDFTKLEISKTDISSGKNIKGATLGVFAIKDGIPDEKPYYVFETDKNSELITHIPVGKYLLRELKTPITDGYITSMDIYFEVKETAEIQKVNMQEDITKLEISKTDITNGEELPGAKLEIRNSDDQIVAKWTSTDKPHYIERLPIGKYTLTEKRMPDGYATSETISFEIKDTPEIQKVKMIDDITKIEISKTDIVTKEEIPGAELVIRNKWNKVVEKWISTNEPHYIEKLPVGDYTLTETLTPDGYATAETIHFTVEDTGEIQKVEMIDDYTKLQISKTDIVTKEEIPGATLQIRNDKEEIINQWTSTDKPHYIEKLPVGDYTLTEILTPDGYATAETIHFTVKDTGEIQKVEMVDDYTKIQISKTDIVTKEEIPGATLQIKDIEGNLIEEWISTDKPHYIEKLPVGDYTLTEILTPDGYATAETIHFTVEDTGEIQKVEMIDDYTKIQISKTDIVTKEEIPGATLQIHNDKGELIKEWVSTNEPYYIEKLPVGNYTLTELLAPDGYIRAETIHFTVEDTGEIQKVEMIDDYTKIQISKTDIVTKEEIPGATLQIHNENGELITEWVSTNEPHYIERLPIGKYTLTEILAPDGYARAETIHFTVSETKEIQKVEMIDDYTKIEISKTDIVTTEEIPGATLQIHDEKGELINEWISTDRPHYIERLPIGNYTLTELLAPDGYVRAETIHFTVEDTGRIQRVEMIDDYTKIEISKTDIVTKEEIPGATLQIHNEKGELINEWVSTNKPHYIEKLPVGNYTLTELLAPDGYVRAETIHFTVEDTGEIQKVNMIDEYIKLEVLKVDSLSNNPLKGARLEIVNTKGDVLYSWTSTDKPAIIERIPVGDYILKEVSAPKNYKLADDIKFTIKETSKVQKLTMVDESFVDVVPTGDDNERNNYSIIILGICVVTSLAYIAISKKKKMNK